MVNVGLGSKYACVVFNQQLCLQKDLTLSITSNQILDSCIKRHPVFKDVCVREEK